MSVRDSIALVRPMAEMMDDLPVKYRIELLSALLAQEICNHPASERADVLGCVLHNLPIILSFTEAGMRDALAANARDGL